MTTNRRKLINKKSVAEKLDISPATFDRHRTTLEHNQGFPPPVLGTDIFGSHKWDERAIDLWLDQRIPAHLTETRPDAILNVHITEQQLAESAAALAI